ncbi:hypothetical protein HPP92_009948 [Vanilla planifolia]|uniref:Uncharacterized protein n=1 Tax=Vanilla planifolia TaxID=51239 RepID=A0A835R7I2_VANPL|nr:hypothetical protein HPP92_009948 [Vanilla planifolia]
MEIVASAASFVTHSLSMHQEDAEARVRDGRSDGRGATDGVGSSANVAGDGSDRMKIDRVQTIVTIKSESFELALSKI